MKIVEARLYRLAIPFRLQISHSLADRKEAEAIVAAVRDEEGLWGYGEGTPRGYVTGESWDSCLHAAQELCSTIIGIEVSSFDDLVHIFTGAGGTPSSRLAPSALCSLELACLDLWGRREGVPISDLLGGGKIESLIYSAVLPILADGLFDRFLDLTAENCMKYVKIKVGSGVKRDVERVSRARSRLGDAVDIRVDANGAYSPSDAIEFLRACEPFRLSAIEQPVPKGDLEGMKKVTADGGVLVIADESLCDMEDARRIVARDACRGFNIRLSKCGGMMKSLAIWDYAIKNGILCQIGSHVGETAILAAAGRHLAVLRPDHIYLEGSFARRLLTDDLSVQEVEFGREGKAPALSGPGLGIDVDGARLAQWGELIHDPAQKTRSAALLQFSSHCGVRCRGES